MFDLVPFRRLNRDKGLTEWEDSVNSLMSNFFSDVMDFAGGGFRTDVKEEENRYTIEAELPGLEKEDINVELDDNRLVISVSNEEEIEEEEGNYIRKERRSGTYQRSFYIENVDEDKIEAQYINGILHIDLPKDEPGKAQKKAIDIK